MRRVWAVGLALLTLGVASTCTGDGPSRPEPAAGKAMRIVGGGSGHVPTGTGKVSATEVDGSHLAAMAVTGEGTVYVLHADGTIYRADTDGRLSRVGGDQSTADNETAAWPSHRRGTWSWSGGRVMSSSGSRSPTGRSNGCRSRGFPTPDTRPQWPSPPTT